MRPLPAVARVQSRIAIAAPMVGRDSILDGADVALTRITNGLSSKGLLLSVSEELARQFFSTLDSQTQRREAKVHGGKRRVR